MPTTTIGAPRYLTRFRCIAQDCEDSCCTTFRVPLDPGGRDRVEAFLCATPEGAARYERVVAQEPDPEAAGVVAHFRMQPDGTCPFLQGDRLCELQCARGEAVLPETCSMFPRAMVHAGDRLEITGTLACPEAARLFARDDGAMSWDELDASRVPRSSPAPWAARWTAADLSFRARGSEVFAKPSRPFGTRVADFLPLALGRGARREAKAPRIEKVTALVLRLLLERRASRHGARFAALTEGILQRVQAAGGGAEAAHAQYLAARGRQKEALQGPLERWMRNYALYQLAHFPASSSPSKASYGYRLGLRLSMARFALALNPAFEGGDPDAVAAGTLQILSKHLEPHPVMQAAVDAAAAEPKRAPSAWLFPAYF